jgi:hypothetical protein
MVALSRSVLEGHVAMRLHWSVRDGIASGAKQAAEKGLILDERPEKHTSGAKQAAEKLIL